MAGTQRSTGALNLWWHASQVLASLLTATLLVGWTMWSPVTIGNDYVVWPFLPNLHAHFYASESIPTIWYPFYTGGFPFGAMPGIQLFNLPAWLLTLIPGYTEGHAIYWNSARYVLVFTLLHYLTARFLSTFMRMGYFAGFLISAPIIYNFRSLDQLRYGVYLEVPFYLLAAILLAAWYYRKRHLATLFFFTVFIQFALTGGHPPSVFYAVLTACLVLLFAVPQLFLALSFDKKQVFISTLHLAGASLVGFLMAAPNWWPTSENLMMNSARVINSTVEWSRDAALNWDTLIANFFIPWEAEVHSAFGGSALYTVLLVGVFAFCLRHLRHFWWALILLLFPIVYSFGGTLFEYFYYYVPGFKWIRIPGRYLAMQPIHLLTIGAVGMAMVAASPEKLQRYTNSLRQCFTIAAFINLIACLLIYGGVVFEAEWLKLFKVERFTPQNILGWSPLIRSVWLIAGITSSIFAVLALRAKPIIRPQYFCCALFILFLAQAFVANRYGSWITDQQSTPKTWEFAKANHLPFYHTAPLVGPIPLDENVGGVATTGYTRFMKSSGANADCFLPVPKRDGSRKTMLPFFLTRNIALDHTGTCGTTEEQQIQQVQSVNCATNPGSIAVVDLPICQAIQQNSSAQDLVTLNSRNRLRGLTPFSAMLSVNAPNTSVLVTPYPWVKNFWKVQVDGKTAQGFQIDAGMLGVLVPRGKHTISIQYVSERTEKARFAVFYTTTFVGLLGLFILIRRTSLRTPRSILVLLIGVVLTGSVVYFTYDWAASFQEELNRKVILPNNYAPLLKEQIAIWKLQSNA